MNVGATNVSLPAYVGKPLAPADAERVVPLQRLEPDIDVEVSTAVPGRLERSDYLALGGVRFGTD